MDLQDRLAVQRTMLANQRTLLSFLMSSLAMAGAGFTLMRFFTESWAWGSGWALLWSALVLFVYGCLNYFVHKHAIDMASRNG